jgi:protein-disulfide isomerase
MNKEKTNFILGIAVGVATVSLIGFIVMSIAYFQKSAPAASEKSQVAQNNPAPSPQPNPAPSPVPTKIDVNVSDSDHIRGNKDAKITLVEFSDFQCPFCARFHNTMKQVMEKYPNDVRWVYKHFPLDSLHPYARKAAEAAECAGEQGKFWEYADKLFENQRNINTTYFSTAAKELGLNTTQFESCLSSGKYASKVNNDYSQGRQAGVTGTPGSVMNGELIKGAVPFETIKAKIDSLK